MFIDDYPSGLGIGIARPANDDDPSFAQRMHPQGGFSIGDDRHLTGVGAGQHFAHKLLRLDIATDEHQSDLSASEL